MRQVKELAVKRETFEGFSNFQEWATKNGPFGAVVDGANVGLYHSNYEGGKFSFAQVIFVHFGFVENEYDEHDQFLYHSILEFSFRSCLLTL